MVLITPFECFMLSCIILVAILNFERYGGHFRFWFDWFITLGMPENINVDTLRAIKWI
jgi:hypothetical protein